MTSLTPSQRQLATQIANADTLEERRTLIKRYRRDHGVTATLDLFAEFVGEHQKERVG